MRRILFTVLASSVLCVTAPSLASARNHHGSHHHRSHSRIRHEHFGASSSAPVTTPAPGGTVTTPPITTPTAGTVASFTNGVLTINLTAGGTVSGMVTASTELECSTMNPTTMQTDDHGGGGDNSGPGNSNSGGSGDNGDDNGVNQGDDNDDQGQAQQCAITALTPGAVVLEADLAISSAGSIWNKVELTA
ncbi:MAG: hypothetical protein M3065_11160 [Actinomycetota bacterium]|nr:hypothetical protein [Actinomycetota bacterium]